jgi:hypothetical protein
MIAGKMVEDCPDCGGFVSGPPEMIPDSMKEDRYKYKKDIVQPYREGVASQEFAEAHPEKAAKMFKGQTPQRVWKGDVEGY